MNLVHPHVRTQSLESRKGEIEFRRRLYKHQIENVFALDNEYDAEGITEVLEDRMQKTLDRMSELRGKGVILAPYLELGAERCQRSLVMENDLGLEGIAADISFFSLRSCEHYKAVFGKNRSPLRICCDAYNLPFASNSIPFVFCYETLHHFPDPTPIISEVHRVISPGGHFFFDEEPFEQKLHLNLFMNRKIYSAEALRLDKLHRILNYFLAKPNCNEADFGIVENRDITIRTWKNALGLFEGRDVTLRSGGDLSMLRKNNPVHRILTSELYSPRNALGYLATYLLGGTITGICRKSGALDRPPTSPATCLVCPSCLQKKTESRLLQHRGQWLCMYCSQVYPVVDNVLFLFDQMKMSELYPDVIIDR